MKRKDLRIFIVISIIVLILPVILFLFNFRHQTISVIQNDWADFSSYFSGILTPIISILSLIILIYIYLLIQKQSSEENHKLFRLQRRIQAYDELLDYLPTLGSLFLRFEQINLIFTNKVYENDPEKKLLLAFEEMKSISGWFSKFHFFLKNFYPRYSHLFNQDINNSTYKNLLAQTEKIQSGFNGYYEQLITINSNENKEWKNAIAELMSFNKNLANYINLLRSELYDPTKIEKLDE
jgi:hypothetical protein